MGIALGANQKMDDVQEVFTSSTLHRLWLFAYLVPVFGMVPALWTLTRPNSDRRHRSISRLALTLGLSWAFGCLLLSSAGMSVEGNGISAQMSLQFLNSLLTSGYFVLSLGLMLRLWKRQTFELPTLARIAKHIP